MMFPSRDSPMSLAVRAAKVRGVQLAIVVDNKDGDGNPGYRVRIKFPWLNDQETTFWARIAVPMAGPERGTYVLPEPDDQVLVVFEHGDINRPIVVGALWSKKQEPVEVNQSGKNNTKLIKSRSAHRIIFDDKEGAEKITIVDKTKKNKIVLDSATKTVKIESDGDIEVIAKANVVMHSNAIKVGAAAIMSAKAGSFLVHTASTFGLKATSGITVGGGATVVNTANQAACSVSGAGAGELGGAAAEAARPQVHDERRASGGGSAATPAAGTAERSSGGASLLEVVRDAVVESDPDPATERVEIVIVDDNDRPVPDIKLVLELADGSTCEHSTDSDGVVVIEDAPIGACTLVLDRKDLAFEQTLEIVDVGHHRPSPADPDAKREHNHRLALVESHRVRTGETLVELARSAGMTWQELARFNFGTDDPAKINGNLRVLVGCRNKTKDGNNYLFSDDDEPGILYIPKLWERGPLHTGMTHIIYVRPLRRAPRPVAFST